MAAPDEGPAGSLHGWLVQHGPALLVWLGLALIGLGVGLDRDWLAGFGLVAVMLGVVLPRVRGSLEATLGGVKVGEIIDPNELLRRIQDKGRNLPPEAVKRAESDAEALFDKGIGEFWRYQRYGHPQARTDADTLRQWWRRPLNTKAWTDAWTDLAAERLLSESARREWAVTFVGPLSDDARKALDAADDIVIGRDFVPRTESHTVIVNAATANEAVNRVREALDGLGTFGRWEAKPFESIFYDAGPKSTEPDDNDGDED
jgi:hypothetical protein